MLCFFGKGTPSRPRRLACLPSRSPKLSLPISEDKANNAHKEADMSEQTQAILDAAMKLSVAERSALANQLMLSLDEEPLTKGELDAMDALWAPEIRRRVAELESGQVQCIPWAEVDARIRKIVGEQS